VATAAGVLTILNSNMANAIRSRTIQKGIDPREFSLVAFGGAGPLHGAEVAAMLEIPEVIVPLYPGITSALGLLTTDLKYDLIKTAFQAQGAVDLDRLNDDLRGMERALGAQFAADGLTQDQISFERWADLRHVGQGYELRVAMAAGVLDEAGLAAMWERFHRLHLAEYGQSFPGSPIEMPRIGALPVPRGRALTGARVRTGRCVFRAGGALVALDTAFYRRELLPLETAIAGPAIVLQSDSTTVIPPGCSATVDPAGNLLIAIGGTHG
jgi:N-methylhydantoinase A